MNEIEDVKTLISEIASGVEKLVYASESSEKLTLSASECAMAAGVSVPTVYEWIRRKDSPLPCIDLSRKKYLILRTDLEEFLRAEARREACA